MCSHSQFPLELKLYKHAGDRKEVVVVLTIRLVRNLPHLFTLSTLMVHPNLCFACVLCSHTFGFSHAHFLPFFLP